MKNDNRAYVRHALLGAVFCVLLPGCMTFDAFLFDPDPISLDEYDFTSEQLDGVDPARITSELIPTGEGDEQIHVIYVERDTGELDPRIATEPAVTVIYNHGNSWNNSHYYYRAVMFEDMGFNVLLYDYRGYGASDGEVTESNIYEDAEAAYDYAATQDPDALIFTVGYSLGGTAMSWLCSQGPARPVIGCFGESIFASVEQIVEYGSGYNFAGSWFADSVFDNIGRLEAVDEPVLLMSGDQDSTVGVGHSEQIWGAVEGNQPENRFFKLEGANHRNVPYPSFEGDDPWIYSHPDELPPDLRQEFDDFYKKRVVDFVVDVLS